jgi:uncharacterized protein YprB with RNaseH-like and TPR domain
MPVTLKPEERDALFEQISADFGMLGDFEMAIEKGNEEECYRIGRRLLDGLRLLVDGGLGWRRRTVEPTILTLPDEEIRRIMNRMRMEALAGMDYTRTDREETQEEWALFPAIKDACDSALGQTHS